MEKKVIFTIDTEGHDGVDPVSHLIWGRTKDGDYGIDKIMDISDEFGIKALFFVDFAEAWDYGEKNIYDIVTHISERGHDVGVHIHPDHMADKKRLFLWEYTRDEQYEMIKKCTDLYVKILGKSPIAFRAGKYGINKDTLDILGELKYELDFSSFFGQMWCGLNPPINTNESFQYSKKLVEVPVTAYKSFSMFGYTRYDKVDLEMFENEFKFVMGCLKEDSEPSIITMFAHSFSGVKWRRNPDHPKANRSNLKKLRRMLEYINELPDVTFISLSDILKNKPTQEYVDCKKVLDISKVRIRSLLYFGVRALKVLSMRYKINC